MAMKRGIRKIVAAGLSALLFLWYFSPAMRTLRALPEGVAAGEKAAAGRFIGTEAWPVRSSGDARLGGVERTYTLFGVVPLRTVQEVAALPAVSLGGRAVGIVLYTKGVQVVGFTTVDTTKGPLSPAYTAGLKKGDAILAVDGQAVRGAMSLMDLLQDKGQVTLTVRREEAILTLSLRPARERATGQDRLGAWVRESTSGIGTLSFCKEDRYCALGHGVTDVDTGVTLLPDRGFIAPAAVTAVHPAGSGQVGELVGTFSTREGDAVGRIDANGAYGSRGPGAAPRCRVPGEDGGGHPLFRRRRDPPGLFLPDHPPEGPERARRPGHDGGGHGSGPAFPDRRHRPRHVRQPRGPKRPPGGRGDPRVRQ